VSGASANRGGGIDIKDCTRWGGAAFLGISANNASTTIPCTVMGCVSFPSSAGVSCLTGGTVGQITENWNLLFATTPRSNVTAGGNSVSNGSYAPLVHIGQEQSVWHSPLPRITLEPQPSSPLLGFGSDGTGASVDARNRPRPAGGASANPAVGALERSNTAIRDTAPIGSSPVPFRITGPGYAEFLVPVRNVATTISVKVKWDATYAGTKPQLQIDANNRVGVAAQTITAVGSSGSVETLTSASFTPSASGDMLLVRVISNDTNGGGLLQADDFSLSA